MTIDTPDKAIAAGRICIWCDCPVYHGSPGGAPTVVWKSDGPPGVMDFCIHESCRYMMLAARQEDWAILLRVKIDARHRGEPTEPYLRRPRDTPEAQLAAFQKKGWLVLCIRPSGWAHLVGRDGMVWSVVGGSVDAPSLLGYRGECRLPDCRKP